MINSQLYFILLVRKKSEMCIKALKMLNGGHCSVIHFHNQMSNEVVFFKLFDKSI